MDEFLKNQTVLIHAVSAGGALTLGSAVTYPLETIKTLIQVGSGPNKQFSTTQILGRVQRLSGIAGLYRGFRWLALERILGVGARFGTYEILTAYYKDGREDDRVQVSEALLAGIAAGAVESIISSPFELIKVRAQVTSATGTLKPSTIAETGSVSPLIARLLRGYTPDIKALNQSVGLLSVLNSKHPNLVGAIKEYPWMMTGSGKAPPVYLVKKLSDIISLEGWGAFWRSMRSGIARDSVFGGVFFSTWQFLHSAMLDWKAVGMDPEPRTDEEIGPLSPLAVSLAAGFSGALAAAVSHSFDTARSRSLCIVQPKHLALERKLLKWTLPGNRFERLTGIHPRDRNILYRGIWHRIARSGATSFLFVGGYLLAINHLVSR